MAGRFEHVRIKRSEMLPEGMLAEAMGLTDPSDTLVITIIEDDPAASLNTGHAEFEGDGLRRTPSMEELATEGDYSPSQPANNAPATQPPPLGKPDAAPTLAEVTAMAGLHRCKITFEAGFWTVTHPNGTGQCFSSLRQVASHLTLLP